ncbi:hypothetical protein BDN70DRAFT_818810, partial [Pholiota conissans]
APGSADAELARMNREGIVHAVLTDNSASLIFGANTVYRITSHLWRKNHIRIDVYFASAVTAPLGEAVPAPFNSISDLIFFALLRGGKYCAGIENCHPHVAAALSRCGYTEELMLAVETLSPDELEQFCSHWRKAIQEELGTQTIFDGKVHDVYDSRLTLPVTFPNTEACRLYKDPLTSWSLGQCVPTSAVAAWSAPLAPSHLALSISHLARFSFQYFDWRNKSVFKAEFAQHVWPGILSQMIYSVCY